MSHPPIVLIPSQLCTELLFREQLPALAAITDARVAVMRDHDTVGAMAQSVLDTEEGRFSLIAHGMGGFVAFEILRRAPERVASLVVMSTLAPNDTPAQTTRREGYLKLVENGNFAGVVDERIPMLFHPGNAKNAGLTAIARQMAQDTGAEAFLRQQRAIMARPDSRPTLADIPCPTLILYARQDGISTLAHQEEMRDGIPNARLEIIEECGHMMTLERPEIVTPRLVDWIAAT